MPKVVIEGRTVGQVVLPGMARSAQRYSPELFYVEWCSRLALCNFAVFFRQAIFPGAV